MRMCSELAAQSRSHHWSISVTASWPPQASHVIGPFLPPLVCHWTMHHDDGHHGYIRPPLHRLWLVNFNS